MHSYSWLKGTKSIEEVIWFHFTSFSKAFGLMGCGSREENSSGSFLSQLPGPLLNLLPDAALVQMASLSGSQDLFKLLRGYG